MFTGLTLSVAVLNKCATCRQVRAYLDPLKRSGW